jgi:hypothetical protein
MDHRYWLGVISDVGEALANILQSFLADRRNTFSHRQWE